ncbi:histidine kinase [Paenibacillus yonginensis]|uniref:Histidine kinase n=1 Tax=Paenibacillus yonginensis TaxID=1462996 RepID=A0A1B1MYD2_9BACL|nr:sensor histidine kinase [Paenibacillus yonginensis]ANS74167.1 histidine kinase [Paenibacillus yonginensis]
MKAFNNPLVKGIVEVRERIRRRLVHKLVLVFTLIIVLLVGSLSVISYQMIQRESVGSSVASTSNNLLLVNRNLEAFLSGIEELSLPKIQYDQLINAVLTEQTEYSSRLYLEQYLKNLFFARKDLEAINMYIPSDRKYYSITREQYDTRVRAVYDDKVPDQAWYRRAMDSRENRLFQSFVAGGSDGGTGAEEREKENYGSAYDSFAKTSFMAYHRVLRSISTRQPQVVFSFYFNTKAADEIMKDIPFAEGEHLLLLGPDGTPFYTDNSAYYRGLRQGNLLERIPGTGSGQLTWREADSKYLVVYNVGEQYGWKLVKPIPYSMIYETANQTRNLSLGIGLILFMIGVVLVVIITNAITRPLKKLAFQMRRFSEGSFDAETEVKGRDEVAYLSRHFNMMVRRTNDLINERYKMKLTEKNAILKALEAEINPHFLYNALQAISTKALKNGMFDISDMVEALALTLRYCISGRDIVTAREELEHVERYLTLQKARFGSRLEVEVRWAEELLELNLPKLSLQSLVENSIKHGLERVRDHVRITIEASANEEEALISVTDNGPGMTGDRLNQVLQSLETDWEERDGGSIGLKNLNTRLKLLFGEASELAIESGVGQTKLTMRIPEGGSGYVQSADY